MKGLKITNYCPECGIRLTDTELNLKYCANCESDWDENGEVTVEELREELDITEKLLKEREKVLYAVPDCPLHGSGCVPWALDWIEKAKVYMSSHPNQPR